MRTTYPVAIVLAIIVASMMWTASGFGGMVGNDPTAGLGPMEDELENKTNESAVSRGEDGGFGGSAAGADDESNIVSFVINGGGAILSIANLIIHLPAGLQALGAPEWFAYPLGRLGQLLGSIGVIQFIVNRVWR